MAVCKNQQSNQQVQKDSSQKTQQKFYNKDWKEIQRTKCMVYSRVMWFIRPVDYFNTWKKSEFYSRTYFNANKSMTNKIQPIAIKCCKDWLLQRAQKVSQTV